MIYMILEHAWELVLIQGIISISKPYWNMFYLSVVNGFINEYQLFIMVAFKSMENAIFVGRPLHTIYITDVKG